MRKNCEGEEIESIQISPCPVCAGSHAYSVRVERSLLIGMVTTMSVQQQERRLTRIFTCPTQGKPFQAVISLFETFLTPIEAVQVLGVDEAGDA